MKILPPTGANDPDLYGAITAQATSRPEIQAPFRRRVFSMAITDGLTADAVNRHRGRLPSIPSLPAAHSTRTPTDSFI